MSDYWVEARLKEGATVKDLVAWMGRQPIYAASIHAFAEPWWEEGWVVRVKHPLYGHEREGMPAELSTCPYVDHTVLWDPDPDEALYGETSWPWVQQFFYASTMLASPDPWLRQKLVHCLLNANGMTRSEEVGFHLRAAWRAWRMRGRKADHD